MNTEQFKSFARWLVNALSGAVLAYSATKSDSAKTLGAFVSQLITGPDVIAAIALGGTWLWGHLTHRTATDNPVANSCKPPGSAVIILILALGLGGVMFGTTGCNTTPQRASFITVTTTDVSVETALRAYNVFAAQGKTTVAQNLQVKAAYEKYQAAFAVLCDVGAVYAATSTTNAPAAAALQQATLNASASIADVINLIQSFGVKLNH